MSELFDWLGGWVAWLFGGWGDLIGWLAGWWWVVCSLECVQVCAMQPTKNIER